MLLSSCFCGCGGLRLSSVYVIAGMLVSGAHDAFGNLIVLHVHGCMIVSVVQCMSVFVVVCMCMFRSSLGACFAYIPAVCRRVRRQRSLIFLL